MFAESIHLRGATNLVLVKPKPLREYRHVRMVESTFIELKQLAATERAPMGVVIQALIDHYSPLRRKLLSLASTGIPVFLWSHALPSLEGS